MQKTNNSKANVGVKTSLKIMLTIFSILSLSGCGAQGMYKKHKSTMRMQTESVMQKENFVQEIAPFIPPITLPVPANHCLLRPDVSIELAVSKTGYTRLFMEDERITDVFVYPQEALQVRIHNQGYLIIVPNDQGDNSSKDKIYLTLTGEQGTTQDLSLHFTGKKPEPVKFIKSNLGTNKATNLTTKGD